MTSLIVRHAEVGDADAVWSILQPILVAGETYALPRDWNRGQALAYWFAPEHEVFMAAVGERVVGTYYMHPNQRGGGSHIANCGYATATGMGGRGIATTMCKHSLARAIERGFLAMQFNFVVSTNERAIRLWRSLGFDVIGVIPQGFNHPVHGFVDAMVMYRALA